MVELDNLTWKRKVGYNSDIRINSPKKTYNCYPF